MLNVSTNKLTVVIDRLKSIYLIAAFLALTFGFALGYRGLSQTPLSADGLRLPDNSTNNVTFGDAVYFSIVTEATLGYGDIRPIGWSRFLACFQVLFGLMLAGVAVAKITSIQGRDLRLVAQKASGDWIEFMRVKNGKINVSFVTIGLSCAVVRYDGECHLESGEPVGFWRGEMIGMVGSCLRFDYSNRESHAPGDSFSEGLATLQFTADSHGNTWIRYIGTAHDFGTKETLSWKGVRASAEESAIIHGTDDEARNNLVKHFAAKVPRA